MEEETITRGDFYQYNLNSHIGKNRGRSPVFTYHWWTDLHEKTDKHILKMTWETETLPVKVIVINGAGRVLTHRKRDNTITCKFTDKDKAGQPVVKYFIEAPWNITDRRNASDNYMNEPIHIKEEWI